MFRTYRKELNIKTEFTREQLSVFAQYYAQCSYCKLEADLEGNSNSASNIDCLITGYFYALINFNVNLHHGEGFTGIHGEPFWYSSNEFSINGENFKITDFESDYLNLVEQAKKME